MYTPAMKERTRRRLSLALTVTLAGCSSPASGPAGETGVNATTGDPAVTSDASVGETRGSDEGEATTTPTTGQGGSTGGESSTTTDEGTTTGTGTAGTTDAPGPEETSGTTGEPGLALPWSWIAALDQGIRDDDYGLGGFQAPRIGYEHSGIDFLMPVGTELRAPCTGKYLADYDGGYGNWVQVICPVPASVAGDATVFASILYAHLDETFLPATGIDSAAAGAVTRDEAIGLAGKTGNAGADGIHAHLHLEIALLGSELAALQEAHLSGDDSDTAAAAALRSSLTTSCLEPTGFKPLQAALHLGRRIDPYMLLTCLSASKPALMTPQIQPLHAWSADYAADAFDVDVGMQ